jgi:hypothetical protein
MEHFLICTNPKCRYLVNPREGAQALERSTLILDLCPDCGYPWSSYCPFCGQSLDCGSHEAMHRCLKCPRWLQPEIT